MDDIRPSFSIKIVVGNASSAKHCYERIMEGVRLGMPIKRRVSKLYYLAMRESDSIKKFIFLWTSLEVLINSSFDKIKPSPTIFPDLDEKTHLKRESIGFF